MIEKGPSKGLSDQGLKEHRTNRYYHNQHFASLEGISSAFNTSGGSSLTVAAATCVRNQGKNASFFGFRSDGHTQVYGTIIKVLIHKELGDGIGITVTSKMGVERRSLEGDRVRIIYDGEIPSINSSETLPRRTSPRESVLWCATFTSKKSLFVVA
jgi:hypothetical protein